MTQKKTSRLTVLEIMVYLVLLLVTLRLVLHFAGQQESESERQLRLAREDIIWFSSALGAYMIDTGKPVPRLEEGGLAKLVEAGYLPYIPQDPYGRSYLYIVPGSYTAKPFEIYSLGADGKESQDDIVSWDLYGRRLPDPR